MRFIIFCWFFVWTSTTRTSWVNTSKILKTAYIDDVTCFNNELLIVNLFLIFSERVINFTFSLSKRRAIITFSFIFSARCSLFISSLTKSVRRLFFSRCFLILKIIVFSLFVFFSCLRWLMLLYDAMMIVVASISRWIFVFAIAAYIVKMMMIFVVFRSILFNLSFIFFSVIVICFYIVNVDNKTLTRWRRNNDMNAFISSIDLSRRKLLISLIMCSLRLFIENFFNVVRIFVKTSRRLMSDDITSIRAKDFCLFTIDR